VRDRRFVAVLPLVAAAGALAACGPTAPGVAEPQTGGAATASGGGSVTLPPRPRDLKVDGVDPCALLTTAQQQQLGLDAEPLRSNPNDPGQQDAKGNPGCDYGRTGSSPRYSYLVTAVPKEGADAWLREKRNAEVRPTSVASYGAVTTQLGTSQRRVCNVVVDVAQEQSLDVQFSSITENAFTRDQLCQKAADGAALAVRTLATMR
jgi:hypothetical protein